jgi:asparagine synthase (glutamine-hydrolysing)
MCGICGKISVNGNVSEELIRKMCGALTHRGPDDEGVYIKKGIGLGHRRLAVIDLSPMGHQPMSNEDASLWIVLNGEIYNFIELKDELVKKGHIFKSHTDTEVILHLYEEKGAECLKDLRGPFAFSIWDNREKSLCITPLEIKH